MRVMDLTAVSISPGTVHSSSIAPGGQLSLVRTMAHVDFNTVTADTLVTRRSPPAFSSDVLRYRVGAATMVFHAVSQTVNGTGLEAGDSFTLIGQPSSGALDCAAPTPQSMWRCNISMAEGQLYLGAVCEAPASQTAAGSWVVCLQVRGWFAALGLEEGRGMAVRHNPPARWGTHIALVVQ